jgi:hypothetical protein
MKGIATRVAQSCFGDNRYFGHAALADLLGNETSTGLVAMAVTGRRPTAIQRVMLDELAVVMTSADPRIWPLKLTRVVASYGGTLAGFAAGHLAMEGETIGPWIIGHAAAQLADLQRVVSASTDGLDSIVRRHVEVTKRLVGYGVPLRKADERMEALTARVAFHARDELPHWRLQAALSAVVREVHGLAPNVGIGMAAMLLDLGYTPVEASGLTTFLNQNVFVANAVEGAQQSREDLRMLPSECVSYAGIDARESPRAVAARPVTSR